MRADGGGILTMIRRARIVLLALLLGGCMSPAMTIDGRSALEQELTRTAIARAVARQAIHKSVLEGAWKIAVSAPNPDDRDWIESCLRERLVELGAEISQDDDAKLPTVEARVVMAGSDVDNLFLGLPVNLSGSYQMIAFYQSITEYGRARMGLTFWSEDDVIVARAPEVKAKAHFKTLFLLTVIGPFSTTDLEDVTRGRFLELGEDLWRGVRESDEWIVPPRDDSPDSAYGSE